MQTSNGQNSRRQGRIWILTIPSNTWTVPEVVPEHIAYIKGQKEIGDSTGFEHWQLIAYFNKSRIKIYFRSLLANCQIYLWK